MTEPRMIRRIGSWDQYLRPHEIHLLRDNEGWLTVILPMELSIVAEMGDSWTEYLEERIFANSSVYIRDYRVRPVGLRPEFADRPAEILIEVRCELDFSEDE